MNIFVFLSLRQQRVFLERVQLLGQLFQTSNAAEEKSESVTAHDQQRQADLDNDNRCSNTTPDLDGFLQRLPACKTMVANFEEKVSYGGPVTVISQTIYSN